MQYRTQPGLRATLSPGLRAILLAAFASGGLGCGGSSSPTAPPVPVATYTVQAVVFYDENNNGALDATEGARVPDVVLEIVGRTGSSAKVSGEARVEAVPAGTHPVAVRTGSLPPFYALPSAPLSVTVPQSTTLLVPLTLDIGTNRANVYMGFGDSITAGQGSNDDEGYRDRLRAKLLAHFGRGTIVGQGISGARTPLGVDRMADSLRGVRPAYSLILFGTNDWNIGQCRAMPPCFTIDNLRDMVQQAKGARSLPVVATIPPANPAIVPAERNEWVADMNKRIRTMAREEGAPTADVEAGFLRGGDLPRLFTDHVHPNDNGYEIISQEFFKAVSAPRETTLAASFAPLSLFLRPPPAPRP